MKYYPLYLNLKNSRVLVVGGGAVAWQKLQGLLESEARVHVVSPQTLSEIRQRAQDGKIRWSARRYKKADMKGARLVIAATDDPILQKAICRDARARRIWVNVVDVPALCDFIAPAVVRQGDVQIAISTGGAAPALAKFLRQKLERLIGPEYEAFVKMAQKWRPAILKLPKEKRLSIWKRVVNDRFLKEIRSGKIAAAEKRFKNWVYDR